MFRQIFFALKDEIYFKAQHSLSTDFRVKIISFLIKIFIFNCLDNLKKDEIGCQTSVGPVNLLVSFNLVLPQH